MQWPASGADKVRLLRQIASFGAVGICATLVHVGLAWWLIERAAMGEFAANACGAAAAFGVSYLGNARITFLSERGLWEGAARYLAVTLTSLALTSAILAVTQMAGWPIYAYALIVVLTVPPATFVLAKFWAFQRPQGPQFQASASSQRGDGPNLALLRTQPPPDQAHHRDRQ